MTETADTARAGDGEKVAPTEAILAAGHRLVNARGGQFTTQELIEEAGVARRTFYRSFPGKDELLIAVIGDRIAQYRQMLDELARGTPDPVERLHLFISSALAALTSADAANVSRFVTTEHWRLHQLFPDEMTEAGRPVAEFVRSALADGAATGVFAPRDVEQDAWTITRVVMSTFHHFAFAPADPAIGTIAETVWEFCLAAVAHHEPPTTGRRRRG